MGLSGTTPGGKVKPVPTTPPAVDPHQWDTPYKPNYGEYVPGKPTTPYYGSGQFYNQGYVAPKVNKTTAATTAAGKVAAKNPGGGTGTGPGAGGASGTAPVQNQPPAPAPKPTAPAPKPTGGGTTTDPGGGTDPAAPPTSRNVVIPDFKLDPAYQVQLTNLNNGVTDYQTATTKAKQDYDTTYGETLHNVGWDPNSNTWLSNPNTQYGAAGRANMEDYGGRGMGRSSGYLEDLSNINDLFSTQVGNLAQQRQVYDSAQDDAYNAFTRQSDLMKTQAGMEAVARIAAHLGVTPDQVRTNPGLTISVPVTNPSPTGK